MAEATDIMVETYIKAIQNCSRNGKSLDESTARTLANYVVYGWEPGSFLMYILANDFVHAAGQADHINEQLLPVYASVLHNEIPSMAWGNPEKVHAWISKGGTSIG